jgi:radical SAM superfamily enzyme YgiQ (UPF0313 family)
MFAFIGFETISESNLADMKKGVNLKIGVENYKNVVDAFHRHGIGVIGAFIIGNDHESPAYYKELASFLIHSGIDVVQLAILTPLPGTEFMEQKRTVCFIEAFRRIGASIVCLMWFENLEVWTPRPFISAIIMLNIASTLFHGTSTGC